MKKIEAYIRPEKIEDMKIIMTELHLNGLSITQIVGCGNQKGWKNVVRGNEVDYNFLNKIKIEMIVLDSQVDKVVESIISKAYTGEFGDGKIFVYDVIDGIRIRTKEHGDASIK